MSDAVRVSAAGASRVRLVGCLLTVLIVTGCGATEVNTLRDAFDALMQRPDVSVVDADHQAM